MGITQPQSVLYPSRAHSLHKFYADLMQQEQPIERKPDRIPITKRDKNTKTEKIPIIFFFCVLFLHLTFFYVDSWEVRYSFVWQRHGSHRRRGERGVYSNSVLSDAVLRQW